MKTILLVDDKTANIETGAIQLRAMGHDVVVAFSFSEATEWMRKEKFDVVMTDVMMPAEMNGLGQDEIVKFKQESVPIGLVVALFALQMNVPEIFIVSDTNHHCHPIASALDALNRSNRSNEARIKSFCGYDCPMIKEEGWGEVKNWAAVLRGERGE